MPTTIPLLLALLVTAPQVARPPTPIAPGSTRYDLGAAGDVSATAWQRQPEMLLSLSDGRGVAWTAPMVLTAGLEGAAQPVVQVFEGRAYVLWHDQGDGAPLHAPKLASVDGVTGSSRPIVTVPVPPFQQGHIAMTVARVGDEVRVHVATAAGGSLRVSSSTDGGASFSAPITRSYGSELTSVRVAAHGDRVHVVVGHSTFGSEETRYDRSSDGGQSFDVGLPTLALHGSGSTRLAVRGDRVAVGSEQTDKEGARFRVSVDGGDSFGPTGWAMWNFGDVTDFDLALTTDGTAVASYRRNQAATGIRTMLMRSSDGVNWTPEDQLTVAGEQPAQLFALEDGGLLASWRGVDQLPRAALSQDHGATFGPAFPLGAVPASGTPVAWAFSGLYRNALAAWAQSAGPPPAWTAVSGGFRPQTILPAGFQSGPTSVGASFERFEGGSVGVFLLSSAPGGLALPDGRSTGLALSPLVLASLDLVGAALFVTVLDASGAGALPALPVTLPAPLILYAVGIAIDPSTGSFGDLSDVVRIAL